MPSKSDESPLIPHARMRALFRALVETRTLSRRLGRRGGGVPSRAEAPFAAAALELREGDLLSMPGGRTALLEHIRAIGIRTGSGAPRAGDLARFLAATPKPFSGSESDRLLCAAGAAMALKSAMTGNVVLSFVEAGQLTGPAALHLFRIFAEAELPLLLLALPASGKPAAKPDPVDLHRIAARASKPAIPVIPVDVADPIALYRVAGESLGRARSGGGTAVLECVGSKTDPIRLLAAQLVSRGIAQQRWVESIAPQVEALLTRTP